MKVTSFISGPRQKPRFTLVNILMRKKVEQLNLNRFHSHVNRGFGIVVLCTLRVREVPSSILGIPRYTHRAQLGWECLMTQVHIIFALLFESRP